MDVSPEGMINAGIFAEYFCSMGESSESTPIVSQLELQHLIQLSFVTARSWRARKEYSRNVTHIGFSSPQLQIIMKPLQLTMTTANQ